MYLPRHEILDGLGRYDAIAIGPGLGNDAQLLENVLADSSAHMVLDADAINTLAQQPRLLGHLPKSCILTPHAKEFDRLFGPQPDWWTRVSIAREQAVRYQVVIVLKNRFTFIATPQGQILVNPTGNAA